MKRRLTVATLLSGFALLVLQAAGAVDWKTSATLPGVDLNGLSAKQRASVLEILRERPCSCGCSMKLAECRVMDPGCSYSTNLAITVVESVKAGKTKAETFAALDASKWAHLQEPKMLDDAVQIPVTGAPSVGPASAKITIVEFSDFQCPYCAVAIGEINALLKAYPTQVRLIFKQFPLETHPQADLAAAAAIAAHKQGKFWPLHDAMFAHRNDLSRKSIMALAKELGLNMDRFESDIDSTEVREAVVRDVQDGDRAHVEGTPTLFISGQRYNGPVTLASLKPIIDAELAGAQTAAVKGRSSN
ncbi:MAG: DsbA family protein [Bryobacteraceae bacterium]